MISLLVLVVFIAIFIWNRLPVGTVAIFTSLALDATGVLSVNEALAGFGDPVVLNRPKLRDFTMQIYLLKLRCKSFPLSGPAQQPFRSRSSSPPEPISGHRSLHLSACPD